MSRQKYKRAYTRGRWGYASNGRVYIKSTKGIAISPFTSPELSLETRLANARLAAHSAELVDMMEMLLMVVERHVVLEGEPDHVAPLATKARHLLDRVLWER